MLTNKMTSLRLCLSLLVLAMTIVPQNARVETVIEDNKDFNIAALIPVHDNNWLDPSICGKLNTQSGIVFSEALRYILKEINKDPNYMYGKTLGYRIYDTCRSTHVVRRYVRNLMLDLGFSTFIGLLGPMASDVGALVAPVSGIFNVPLISYSSPGRNLEDRGIYFNFYRTSPSNTYQTRALLDVIMSLGWTYISVVLSQGADEQMDVDEFTELANGLDICISRRLVISRTPASGEYNNVITDLLSDPKAKVVVLMTRTKDSVPLLTAAKEMNVSSSRFVWLGTDNWNMDSTSFRGLESIIDGALIVGRERSVDGSFRRYFSQLNPSTANYSLFHSVWEKIFNCRLNGTRDRCTGNETLTSRPDIYERSPVQSIFKGVFSFICAFRSHIEQNCVDVTDLSCIDNATQPRYELRKYILKQVENGKTACLGDRGATFDTSGGVPGRYTLYNIRESKYEPVGHWRSVGTGVEFKLSIDKIHWPHKYDSVPESVCSRYCYRDEIQVTDFSSRNPRCCWDCEKCLDNDIKINNTCISCKVTQAPDEMRRSCLPRDLSFIDLNNDFAMACLFLSLIGIISTTYVFYLFVRHRNSRIVKASGRELCFIILIGIYIGFLSPIVYLSKPHLMFCGLQRLISGVALSLCYAPLFLKTNRIYRIFQSARSKITRPPMISPISQVMISLCIVSVQLLVGIVWIVGDLPQIIYVTQVSKTFVIMTCSSSVVAVLLNLIISFTLMLICTFYAFKTRKYPKNYNESKSIGATMYVTCLLWAVFFAVYMFISDRDGSFARSILTAYFAVICGYITLIGLFAHKVYILLMPSRATISDDDLTSSTGRRPGSYNNASIKTKKFVLSTLSTASQTAEVCTTTSDAGSDVYINGDNNGYRSHGLFSN